jgi:hypothetical protein
VVQPTALLTCRTAPARSVGRNIPDATSLIGDRNSIFDPPSPRAFESPTHERWKLFVELDGALQRHALRHRPDTRLVRQLLGFVTWRSRRYGAVITSPLWGGYLAAATR